MALVPVLVLAMALSGCGANPGAAAPPARVTVRSATIPGLGRVLVDGAGFTLYAYIPDRRGASRCYGVCAHQWPPVVLPAGQRAAGKGPGVDGPLLGTARRTDGARQVTYDGWPLYTYFNDARPGQATGQGEDMGAWYTISVTGVIDHNLVRDTHG